MLLCCPRRQSNEALLVQGSLTVGPWDWGEPHVVYTASFSFQSMPGPKEQMRATHFQGTNLPRIPILMEWGGSLGGEDSWG